MPQPYWDPELETAPWKEVLNWQAALVVPFLRALPGRSAFHRTLLGRARLPEHAADLDFLADLPFTTKDEIRRSQAERRPGEPFGRHQGVPLSAVVQILSSSGTTGEPVIFALTGADLEVWRDGIAAGFYTAGIRDDDVVAHLVGLPGVAGGLPYADGFRRIGATLAWIGGLPTERIIQMIPRLQASAVLATTSFGTYLADRCRDLIGRDASSLGVRKLLGVGDVMSLLWAECEAEGGMHFCGQRSVAVELIDPASGAVLPWEDGVRGEAVYTTFAREATPALRYRSADHLAVTAMSCACGRTAPRIRCVGRTDDMLIYKAMNVFPSAIRDVVMQCFSDAVEPYLRIWKDRADQVRYDTAIPVDVEASPGLAAGRYEEVARAIERELRGRLQIRADVTILGPETLPRTAYKTPLLHVREQSGAQST